MRQLIIKSVFTMGCLYSGYVSAACIQNPSFNNIQVNVPSRTLNIQYDDTTIKDLVTLTVPFGSQNLTTYSGGNGVCGAASLYGNYINGWTPNSAKVANTNVSGIGVLVRSSGLGDFNMFYGTVQNGGMGWQIFNPSWTIIIKKTGLVNTNGSLKSGAIARLYQGNPSPHNTTWILSTFNMPANAIKINVLSCSLKNNKNTYDINMGDWYDTQFKNINDTQGTVAIPIALSCLSGTNIKVTVTSDTIDNAANGRLGLTGADKATGIAVQLLNNAGTPIVLNQKLTQQDNVAQGDYIFGWKARYIKTAATITPGTANANATVNIRYE
ncbi:MULTISPECIES: fimbrial protein [Providencia]|uniref:fimbrial protein n=2 Tax=Morganellaceae TaxID=1903414 RepID=UPI000D38CFB7|nr:MULTISPECIES: fimbrial protein [Providencia]MBG5883535.1 fimbrial protein [Providencia alcalifaciens]MTB46729.1 fimbrial protein [Providencia sp. wls1950]MTC23294.1 fimbrial protein [Providencia sp. wls1938]MTC78347.1 fimbrial protein [Providencia sp. wls1916]